jgi:transcriptional regulator CtsR
MKNKWTKTILISMLAVLVMAIGAVGVFAQTEDAVPAEQATGVDQFHGRGRGGFPGGHDASGDRQAELAKALGITVEELEAAQQEAHEARIAQLVEDGVLTLDQANLMLAMDALKQNIDRDALMAGVLGLSVEEFEAARENGTLRDLLADITPAELQEKTQAAFEDALQQAVEDKVITAEQAELIRENMGEGFGFGGHRGFGGHARPGGFGGRDKGDFSAPEDLQNTFAPSV